MVLSNKKLKQKLREALTQQATTPTINRDKTQCDVAAATTTTDGEPNIEELMRCASKGRPTLSKREKRRQSKEIQEASPSQTQNSKDEAKESKKEKNKGTQIEQKAAHLENKGTHLENGGTEDNNASKKKKKRKKEESKDSHKEEGTQMVDNGDQVENGHVGGGKTSKKKKMKKQKQKEKNRQGGEDNLASSGAAEPSEDIIINASEATVFNGFQSQESEYEALKVYVGGIPYYSTEDDIRSFFESCGTITEMVCMVFPDTEKFRGIALISFETEDAAKRALALDGAEMDERYLKIQRCRKIDKRACFEPTNIDKSNRAYIGNLSWDITEDDLKNFFKDCQISTIRLGKDKETGKFKGYGHVDFADEVSLAMALKLDQEIVCGRPIRISYAVPRRDSNSDAQSRRDSNTDAKPRRDLNADGKDNSTLKKKKRQTCYTCGKPGHLSSSCTHSESTENTDGKDNSTSKKKKRQTCYTCGKPGHLSSSCPQNQSTEKVDANGGS